MNLIDCSKVYVKNTESMGLGAFINQSVKDGTLIEKGIVKIIDTDGNKSPYLFTWSPDRTVWAFASGCATFYNTSLNPNCKLIRHYDTDTFEIYALKDIEVNYCNDKYTALETADALILVTEWKEFRSPDFDLMKSQMNGNLFIDGRNQFKTDFIESKGFKYVQIGVKE